MRPGGAGRHRHRVAGGPRYHRGGEPSVIPIGANPRFCDGSPAGTGRAGTLRLAAMAGRAARLSHFCMETLNVVRGEHLETVLASTSGASVPALAAIAHHESGKYPRRAWANGTGIRQRTRSAFRASATERGHNRRAVRRFGTRPIASVAFVHRGDLDVPAHQSGSAEQRRLIPHSARQPNRLRDGLKSIRNGRESWPVGTVTLDVWQAYCGAASSTLSGAWHAAAGENAACRAGAWAGEGPSSPGKLAARTSAQSPGTRPATKLTAMGAASDGGERAGAVTNSTAAPPAAAVVRVAGNNTETR